MIEVRVFDLRPGVAEDDFRAADHRVQTEFSPFQAGFVRRTTARGDGRSWLVLTLWASAEALDAALRASAGDDVTVAFDALIDPATDRTTRFQELGG